MQLYLFVVEMYVVVTPEGFELFDISLDFQSLVNTNLFCHKLKSLFI